MSGPTMAGVLGCIVLRCDTRRIVAKRGLSEELLQFNKQEGTLAGERYVVCCACGCE